MRRKIGILTPFVWTAPSGVNRQVRVSPVGSSRAAIGSPSSRRAPICAQSMRPAPCGAVLTGERDSVFLPTSRTRGTSSRERPTGCATAAREAHRGPADLIANIDVLLGAEDFDLLHLIEPFVPGLGWTTLRHASCPLVATFHANPEPMRPFWATRPQLHRLFDSLDAAIASSPASRDAAATSSPAPTV